MKTRTKYMIVLVALCMALVFISPCHCGTLLLKVFANDRKAATQSVYKTMKALSDIHCASLFEHDGNAVSFSFNKQQQTCELGDQLPEDSNEEAEGWTLVAKIVDGVWGEWQSWGTCSVTRTRTRLCLEPSNGGALCTGSDTEEENCIPLNTLLPVVSETLSTNFTVDGWEPSRAVDGDMNTASMSHCTYESVRIQPYWRAEFDSTWSISTVKLFIHEKSQLRGVEVSLQDVMLTESCGADGSETGFSHIKPCTYTSTNGPHETTFLHIQLQTAEEVLEIYEIEVRS